MQEAQRGKLQYEPGSSPGQKHQPDLQRFRRKQVGTATSRLPSLQLLRQQLQQQGFRTQNRGSAMQQSAGDLISWYKGLNLDRKVALASISLLLLLLLTLGAIALAGGFQDLQGQNHQNNSSPDNPTVPLLSSTTTSIPSATATTQATSTSQPIQQPVTEPTNTPVPNPTPTPRPTTQPTVAPTPTTLPTPAPTKGSR